LPCCSRHRPAAHPALPPLPTRRSSDLDGMGPAYVTATRLARGGSAGRLHLDDLPYTALVRTYAADGPVTDSAAAATAMACGAKRSEEHTSELQSRFDLVCRLLLEKKKT